MQTRPLPRAIYGLFIVSWGLILVTFILDMINLGQFSVWMIPVCTILTIAYQITLFILSRRQVGPPPLAHAANSSPINQSRTSVYRPASPSGTHLEANDAPIIQERHVYTGGTAYPSYTVNLANCIITCLLAILWGVSSWIPPFVAYADELDPIPQRRIIPYLEGAFGYCECLLLFGLFGLCVHHRRKQLHTREFIRMDN
jgi:hypothetical protein